MPVSSGNVYLHESILSDQYPYHCERHVKAHGDDGQTNYTNANAGTGEQTLRQSGIPDLSSDQNRPCRDRHILISPKIFSFTKIDHKQAVEVEQTHAVSPVEKEESGQRQPLRHHGSSWNEKPLVVPLPPPGSAFYQLFFTPIRTIARHIDW